jgi:hypothetical protein
MGIECKKSFLMIQRIQTDRILSTCCPLHLLKNILEGKVHKRELRAWNRTQEHTLETAKETWIRRMHSEYRFLA